MCNDSSALATKDYYKETPVPKLTSTFFKLQLSSMHFMNKDFPITIKLTWLESNTHVL